MPGVQQKNSRPARRLFTVQFSNAAYPNIRISGGQNSLPPSYRFDRP